MYFTVIDVISMFVIVILGLIFLRKVSNNVNEILLKYIVHYEGKCVHISYRYSSILNFDLFTKWLLGRKVELTILNFRKTLFASFQNLESSTFSFYLHKFLISR